MSVSVERPIQLNAASRRELQTARTRLKEAHRNGNALLSDEHRDGEENVLERAYEDLGDSRFVGLPLYHPGPRVADYISTRQRSECFTVFDSKEAMVRERRLCSFQSIDLGST